MEIRVRSTEGDDAQPYLLWSTDFDNNGDPSRLGNGFFGDWSLAPPSEALNKGGLKASSALCTAIVLCLFTWRRAEPYDALPSGDDPQGWWGDAIDIETDSGETVLGSKLWLLLRSPLNARTAQLAEAYAYEALQPLIDQGAVAQFVIAAPYDVVKGHLYLDVRAFSQAGDKVFDQKFSILWSQLSKNRS